MNDDTQHVPDPREVPTVHAVGKYFPVWNLRTAIEMFYFGTTSAMVLGCIVYTFGSLYGVFPCRCDGW